MSEFRAIIRVLEFNKDFKKLSKRFRTLESDLKIFCDTQLVLFHKRGIDNGGVEQIPGLKFKEPKIYKARKFASKALKGKGANSGIRIIYAYFQSRDDIEFIEIYYKGDEANENKKRIKSLYGLK